VSDSKSPVVSDLSPPEKGGGFTNLDIWSYYDRNTPITAKLIRYPDGSSEALISRALPVDTSHEHTPKGQGSTDHSPRNILRAKSLLRKKLKSAKMCYMLTLTTRANIKGYRETQAMVTKFLRKLRSNYDGVKYLGVPERQKRGAWHWHFAVDQRLDVNLIRKLWQSLTGGKGSGSINIQPKTPKELTYLAKYMTKDSDKVPSGCKRYLGSQNIKIDEEKTTHDNLSDFLQQFHAEYQTFTGEHFITDNGSIWIKS